MTIFSNTKTFSEKRGINIFTNFFKPDSLTEHRWITIFVLPNCCETTCQVASGKL